MVTTYHSPFAPSMALMLLRYMHNFICLPLFFPKSWTLSLFAAALDTSK